MADDQKSKNQIFQALVALRHNLYQANASTRLALPRSSDGDDNAAGAGAVPIEVPCPLSRHLSLPQLSPYQSMPGKDKHIGMQRLDYLFSIKVGAARGLPPSMNGLLLAVSVRQKETRDGAVQTMPTRVQNGNADFNETLYVRCHLYRSGSGGTGKPLKFEARPFLLSAVAIGAPELDFGQSSVDFSAFVNEFTEKCQQGECPSQWDATFPLSGKARGGDLVVKLAFQIMEGLGLIIKSQPNATENATNSAWSSLFARKVIKSSFIIMSPKMLRSQLSFMSKVGVSTPDLKDTDDLKPDEPASMAEVKAAAPAQQKEPEHKLKLKESKEEEEPEPKPVDGKSDDSELPEFDVVEKEVEAEKALEATGLNTVLDAVAKLVEQLEAIGEEVIEESFQPPEANGDEVTGELLQSLKLKETKEEEQKESEPKPKAEDRKPDDSELPEFDMVGKKEVEAEKAPEAIGLSVVLDAIAELVEQLEAIREEVIEESLQPPKANMDEMTGELLQSSKANRLQEANGEAVTGEFLQPPEADKENVTGDSLLPLEADWKNVTGEFLEPSAKSPPRRIRRRTLAIIFAPVAILISRALAGRMRRKH